MMVRTNLRRTLTLAALLIAAAGAALADNIITITSLGVDYSVHEGGLLWVRTTPIVPGAPTAPGQDADAEIQGSEFHLATRTPGSEAGIVLFFDAGLPLGFLQNVSVVSTGQPLYINLWLDTSGDGKFFAFNPAAPPDDHLTSLNSDTSYGSGGSLDGTSVLTHLGGLGSGSYTLSELQNGAVPGIEASTPVALWIGIGYDSASSTGNAADIESVGILATPEPGTLLLFGGGLILLGLFRRKRK